MAVAQASDREHQLAVWRQQAWQTMSHPACTCPHLLLNYADGIKVDENEVDGDEEEEENKNGGSRWMKKKEKKKKKK